MYTSRAMTSARFDLERVDHLDEPAIEALAAMTIAVVAEGASIGFMNPLSEAKARGFWRGVAAEVDAGRRLLLVARDAEGLCGTCQVVLAQPDNQPHRGDLAKMMVHPRSRGRGLGGALLAHAEAAAHAAGKTLLVLDTAGDAAMRVYERGGWTKVGVIPDYALLPAGGLSPTVIYYKALGRAYSSNQ